MAWRKSNNKYGAIKQSFNGRVYDSGLEKSHAVALDLMLKGGQIKSVTPQYKIDLYFYDSQGNKHSYKSWKVDFLVENNDGTYELQEVKGLAGEDFLWKKNICEKVWLKDNPGYTLKILYEKDIRRM